MTSRSANTREPDRHGLDAFDPVLRDGLRVAAGDSPAGSSSPPSGGGEAAAPRRPRGRPALHTRSEVLDEIRALARRGDGLFRIHHSHPDLYARARRFFGAWAEAVKGAGIDYESVVRAARSRSREPLRKRRGAPAGR